MPTANRGPFKLLDFASPPSLVVNHYLNFAQCCRIFGYIEPGKSTCICQECLIRYVSLPDQEFYEKTLTHFAKDGPQEFYIYCTICRAGLLIQNPIACCPDCTRAHALMLSQIRLEGRDYRALNFGVFLHAGQDFRVSPSWEVLVQGHNS